MERDEEGIMPEHDIAQAVETSAAARWRERLGRADEQPTLGAAARWREQLRGTQAQPVPTTAQRWRERFSPTEAAPARGRGWLARLRDALPTTRPISPTPAIERSAAAERQADGAVERGRPMFPD